MKTLDGKTVKDISRSEIWYCENCLFVMTARRKVSSFCLSIEGKFQMRALTGCPIAGCYSLTCTYMKRVVLVDQTVIWIVFVTFIMWISFNGLLGWTGLLGLLWLNTRETAHPMSRTGRASESMVSKGPTPPHIIFYVFREIIILRLNDSYWRRMPLN